jgi:hypothetical protein
MHATLFRRPSSTDGAATPHLLFLMERQLSLSRLHHWLPRGQTHPDVVQGTAECHHQSADAFFPEAEAVFDNATTLDPAVDMLDPQPTLVQGLVRPVLLQCALLAPGVLGGPEALHLRERARQDPQILHQPTAHRQGIQRRIRYGLLMGAAALGVTGAEDKKQGIDEQDIFDGVVLCLAALTRFLCSRVLGADDPSFRPVMGTRGASGGATGAGSSASAATRGALSVAETPSRWARAVRERAGASPRGRHAGSSTGSRTCIH